MNRWEFRGLWFTVEVNCLFASVAVVCLDYCYQEGLRDGQDLDEPDYLQADRTAVSSNTREWMLLQAQCDTWSHQRHWQVWHIKNMIGSFFKIFFDSMWSVWVSLLVTKLPGEVWAVRTDDIAGELTTGFKEYLYEIVVCAKTKWSVLYCNLKERTDTLLKSYVSKLIFYKESPKKHWMYFLSVVAS